MQTSEFHYDLPDTAIAQSAIEPRDASRLLVVSGLTDRHFRDLPDLLQPGDLLVVNRTKVRAARLACTRADTGGRIELLLVRRVDDTRWEALARPSRRLRPDIQLTAGDLTATVLSGPRDGVVTVRLAAAHDDLEVAIAAVGTVPLPPYFHELARGGTNRRSVARSLNLVGWLLSMAGHPAEAIRPLEEALAIDRELGDGRAVAVSLSNLGEAARLEGDFERAEAWYREALTIQLDLGDRDNGALSLSNIGGALVGLGRHEEAVESLQAAIDAFELAAEGQHISETHRFMAEALLALGRVDAALKHARAALHAGVGSGNTEQMGHAWRVLGGVAAASGAPIPAEPGTSPLTAEACFEESESIFARSGLERDRAVTLANWSAAVKDRDAARSAELAAEATRVLQHLGYQRLLAMLGLDADPSDQIV